jgi:uncharacterized protein
MRRILSLDGGGIRGIFSLQVLARLEELLREEQQKPDLVLADVFHLFAGTSTGAIIATFLAWGMSVREIEKMYIDHGAEMFSRERWYLRWKSKYRAESIAEFFRTRFCDDAEGKIPAKLGSQKLRTLLLVIMRNASTGSPWPISNNPNARYNDISLDDCNLEIPIWQLLRASTAAPAYFPPEEITLAGRKHLFVDGGITPFNNPSLLAILMATLPPYRLCWPTGREKLHVISIGTGSMRPKLPQKIARKINVFDQLKFLVPALFGSVSLEQDLLCRVMGDCVYGAPLDGEIGALDSPTMFASDEQKFTYVRYDRALDAPDLPIANRVGTALDNLALIPALQSIGNDYARANVRLEHLYARGSGEMRNPRKS